MSLKQGGKNTTTGEKPQDFLTTGSGSPTGPPEGELRIPSSASRPHPPYEGDGRDPDAWSGAAAVAARLGPLIFHTFGLFPPHSL